MDTVQYGGEKLLYYYYQFLNTYFKNRTFKRGEKGQIQVEISETTVGGKDFKYHAKGRRHEKKMKIWEKVLKLGVSRKAFVQLGLGLS